VLRKRFYKTIITIEYMRLVMDSDSLIKLTKAGAKGIVLDSFDVCIPPKVREECTTIPKKEGYADAFEIDENLKKGRITVKKPTKKPDVDEIVVYLGLGGGEAEALRLYHTGGFDAISSDDSKFLKILDEFDITYLTPTAVILNIYKRGALSLKRVKEIMKKLKNLVSEEEYYLAVNELEKVEREANEN